jgi:hypothetical protein
MSECEMPFDEDKVTNYNPLHKEVGLVPQKRVCKYIERVTHNKYIFEDKLGNKKTCFKKFITLVDYVKFLIGKYKPEETLKLPAENYNSVTKYDTYINSKHNYAYVDGYFYYLTSKLLDAGFIHGLEYYDNYICITNNCELNIADDFEYLSESTFFTENTNKLFKFKDDNFGSIFNKKDPVNISNEEVDLVIDELEDLDMNELTEDMNEPTEDTKYEEIIEEQYAESECGSSDDSDHSTIDLSDDEPDQLIEFEELTESLNKENEDEDEWETEDGSSDNDESFNNDEINNLTLIINKIPTQVISIECCESTFDSLLEENNLRIEELESAMFQVIAMLYLYQQTFKFTHNDLHTNNIMFISTQEEFLHYKILGKYYKVPTYGKIYKIIDFGRSIYTVNNVLLCSDSFSENGTANTQYNCEPFYNPEKPVIEPNYSFDLCRLGCSMVDFIVEDMRDIQKYRKSVPVYDLIISWLYDDNGVNILYKKNGDERYPDFKLYKMIARIVHNHTPEKQFEHVCFKKFETDKLEKCMDLENIKNQVHL